jgi:hypothetical protein
MQKRRILPILIFLIPALLLLGLLGKRWNWFDQKEGLKELSNLQGADRIILVDSYHNVELNKRDSTWYLFGSEAVSPVAVENLLYTAGRLEVASIVSLEAFEAALENQGEVKRITFFSGEKILFDCGFIALSDRYLLHTTGSSSAYYVSLPGYPGLDLDRIFSASPDHYREHLLIDLKPSEISSIEIELANGQAFHFTQDQEGNISCFADNDNTALPDGKPNELAMRLLFSYFMSIRYEKPAGLTAPALIGSEEGKSKLATIRVSSFAGEQHSLQVFPYYKTPDSEPDLFRALVLYDDQQDVLLMNYIHLDVLMRDLSHYFGEK